MSGPRAAVFFGSGPFAVPVLAVLAADPDVTVVTVVTTPVRPAGRQQVGRPTPVGALAAELGLTVATPASLRTPSELGPLVEVASQLIVLADYGRLLPPALVDRPAHGALNLHPSLLPRWRGATPVAQAIAAGDEVTGVSLMRMDQGLDTGPLIAQVTTAIEPDETAPQLEARLAALAAALLRQRLGPWLRGEIAARPQPAAGVSVTRPFTRRDGLLDVSRPAPELARRVRALQPWPGSYLETAAGRLVLWQVRARADPPPHDGAVGSLVAAGDGLGLIVQPGWLALDEVQLAGGRRMAGAALRRGHPDLVGTRVVGAVVGP